MKEAKLQKLRSMLSESPAMSSLGITMDDFDEAKNTASFSLAMKPEFERVAKTGQYHGGVIMAFADSAGDFAVAFLVGGLVPTMNFCVDFLRPAVGPKISATAIVRKIGRTTAVVDVEVFDTASKLVAVGRGTYVTTVG